MGVSSTTICRGCSARVSRMSRPKALTRSHNSTERSGAWAGSGPAGGSTGWRDSRLKLAFGLCFEQGRRVLELLVLDQLPHQLQTRVGLLLAFCLVPGQEQSCS